MEIAFALAGLLAISLIVVPRLRRRGRGRVQANAGKQWTASHAARRPGANGRATGSRLPSRNTRTAAVAAAGAGGTGIAYATDAGLDWDDALGWGGDTAVADPPPSEPAAASTSTPALDEPSSSDW